MKSTFSQRDIGEDTIYLTQPEGFKNTKNSNKVLLLGKALYGLKQSANIWFNLLAKEIIALDFTQLKNDSYLYYNKSKDTIIIVYVDNIAIMGPNISYIKEIIAKLGERFIISDLRPIQSYLGIDIIRSQDLKITTLL